MLEVSPRRVEPSDRYDSVLLVGGPMDGWIVAPDAPCLRPDWSETWPRRKPGIVARARGKRGALIIRETRRSGTGRYVVDGQRARWESER